MDIDKNCDSGAGAPDRAELSVKRVIYFIIELELFNSGLLTM